MRVGQKNKLTYRWARKGSSSPGHPRSTHPINLSVRRVMPRARSRRCPRAARLQHRGHAAPSGRNRNERKSPPAHTPFSFSIKLDGTAPKTSRLPKHLAPAAAAACTRSSTLKMAVYAGELAVEPHLQILRRIVDQVRLERAHRSALENHVHRSPRLGSRRSLIVRIGIRSSEVTLAYNLSIRTK